MKVLVVGSGGREHAICWRLKKSRSITQLFCAPGNSGISEIAQLVACNVDDIEGIRDFCLKNRIDLVVVGPEYPLSLGLADVLRGAGVRVFGPSKEAAQLEVSKSFAKQMMIESGVPTARYEVVHSRSDAERVLSEMGVPVVLKADGLAAGKGVFVCHSQEQVSDAVRQLFSKPEAEQPQNDFRVVIEEFLPGIEISYMIATDGENIVPLAPSHDYKRIYDGDKGPNTGGMGSVCPTPRCLAQDEEAALYEVMVPLLSHMKRRGTPFRGFLYAGLMKSPSGAIKVLEFNVRLGDPETQSIMRTLDSDLFDLLWILSDPSPKINPELPPLSWSSATTVCIVIASEGYPGTPKIGDSIVGIEQASAIPGIVVFHAGTERRDGMLLTAGGRVLGITCQRDSVESARAGAYQAADMIQFRGRHLRRDIGC